MNGITKRFKQLFSDFLPLILAIVVPLIIYSVTAARLPTGFADSDELLAAGYSFSLGHPPGYPLLILLTNIFTHLPLPLEPAFKAHIFNSILASFALGFLFLTIQEIFSLTHKFKVYQLNLIALLAVYLLAVNRLFWLYAANFEVFALKLFLVSVSLWLAFAIRRKPSFRRLFILGVGLGLAISHHALSLLVLPLFGALLLPTFLAYRIRFLITLLAGFLTGFLMSAALLWVLITANNFPGWTASLSLDGLKRLIFRSDYGGVSIETGVINAWFSRVDFQSARASLQDYFERSFIRHWGVVAAGVILIGIIAVRKLPKSIRYSVWGVVLLSGPLLAGYLSLSSSPTGSADYFINQGIRERMFLLGYVVQAIVLAMGLLKIAERFGFRLIASLGILTLGMLFLQRLNEQNLATYVDSATFWRESLISLPKEATLVCFSDTSCFSLAYLIGVQKMRNDVEIVPITPQYRISQGFKTHNYPDNPFRIGEQVSMAFQENRRVFLAEYNEFYGQWLGLNDQNWQIVPFGNVYEIGCGMSADYLKTSDFEETNKRIDHFSQAFRAFRAEQLAHQAVLLQQASRPTLARDTMTRALKANPDNPRVKGIASRLGFVNADSNWTCRNLSEREASFREFEETSQLPKAYREAYFLTLIDPGNPKYRVWHGSVMRAMGFTPLAKREFEIALTLAPEDEAIKAALRELKAVPSLADYEFGEAISF